MVLKTKCIRQHEMQLPTVHRTTYYITILRALVRESPACLHQLRAWKFLTATLKSICNGSILRVVGVL